MFKQFRLIASVLLLCFLPFSAQAASTFTQANFNTIKAYILGTPALAALMNSGQSQQVADALNAASSPAYIVWRTSVNPDEIMRNGMDWTRVDNLTVGKSRIWEWMTRLGTFDCSRDNIRAGIDATWVGTSADLAVRATVYTHCKRTATVLEKVCASGTGSDASPATMTYEGAITPYWVDFAVVNGQ